MNYDEYGEFDDFGNYGDYYDEREWEDDMYADEQENNDVYDYGDESTRVEFGEGAFDSSFVELDDEIEYGENFKDRERVGVGEGVIGGRMGKFQKAVRDPREKAIAEIRGIIFEGGMSHFKENVKKNAITYAKRIDMDAIPLMNGEILSAVLIYMSMYGESTKDLNQKNLKEFMNKIKSADILATDIIRYFRYIKMKME